MPRIPPVLGSLPETQETFVQREPYATIFDALADGCNYFAGFRFLRCVPVIVAPFVRTRRGNTADVEHTRAIRFTTSSLARYIFVAVGYSKVSADGYVNAVLREAHSTIPGAGDIIDPGCRFVRANNDLPNPIEDREYAPTGLKWAHSGFAVPPSVLPTDAIGQRPRMLNCVALTDVDVVLTWDAIKLNAVLVAEAWRPNV